MFQRSLPPALVKDSSRCCWPGERAGPVLAPLAFLVSPLELETPLAEPGGVLDAQRGDIWSSLCMGPGLLDIFPRPLVLFCADAGLGVATFSACRKGEATSSCCCEL